TPNSSLNLNSVKLRRLVDIRLTGVYQNYSVEQLPEIFGITGINVSSTEFDTTKALLNHPQRQFRGKYQVAFTQTFLRLLKNDALSKSPTYFSGRCLVSKQIDSEKTFLSDFAHYADTPLSFDRFLDKYAARVLGEFDIVPKKWFSAFWHWLR